MAKKTASIALGYMAAETRQGNITDFKNRIVGTYRITSSWRTPKSYVSDRMFAIVVRLKNGTFYTARSAGKGMSVVGKRKAMQSWD